MLWMAVEVRHGLSVLDSAKGNMLRAETAAETKLKRHPTQLKRGSEVRDHRNTSTSTARSIPNVSVGFVLCLERHPRVKTSA